jgi:DNA-binding MarR family transcriptional regulator
MPKSRRKISPFGAGTSNLRTTVSRLSYVNRLLDRQTKKYLSDQLGLTNAEWVVLGYLAWNSPQSVAAISSETALFRSQVSRAIAELEHKGLVTRNVDVRDRRSPTFDLSDLGATMQQKLARWALRRQRRLETVMKPTQIKELDEMLGLLARYLESLRDDL